MRRTRIKRGGKITKHNIFSHILSIGYEVETNAVCKLSEITPYEPEPNVKVLLNLKHKNEFADNEDDEDEEDEDDVYILKQEYVEESVDDPNILFQIANDQMTTRLEKYLETICDTSIDKNELYTFATPDMEYKLNFYDIPKCSEFADTEWIVTFYKPRQSPNIIMETFAKTVDIIYKHIQTLQPIQGNLFMNFRNDQSTSGSEYAGSDRNLAKVSKTHGKLLIDFPETRTLFHKPNTNLYYMQLLYSNNPMQSLLDACVSVQMTFASDVIYTFRILKQLAENCVPEPRVMQLYQVERLVKSLIGGKSFDRALVGYLYLFWYKLYVYYTSFLGKNTSNEDVYLKNKLFANVRHTNYDLYLKMLPLLPQGGVSETTVDTHKCDEGCDKNERSEFLKLLLQPNILTQFFPNTNANVFDPNNILDVTDPNYGNPSVSLRSYFDFFKNPPPNAHFNDWLQHANIDVYSANMEINNNVVLVEFRSFYRCISDALGKNYINTCKPQTNYKIGELHNALSSMTFGGKKTRRRVFHKQKLNKNRF